MFSLGVTLEILKETPLIMLSETDLVRSDETYIDREFVVTAL